MQRTAAEIPAAPLIETTLDGPVADLPRSRAMPREKLLLVALNDEQIVAAKAANGSKKRITHGLICGKYGQIFGTENQCRKYFEGWGANFRRLFEPGEIREHIEIQDFASTFNLVERLLQANGPLEQQENAERLGYRS